MNRLQGIPDRPPLFVTLNPPRPPRATKCLHSETYDHPLFDRAAIAAQQQLWTLQGAATPGSAAPISALASTRTDCRPASRSPRRWAA